MKTGSVNSRYIFESKRLNSDFHLTEGVVYDRFFRSKAYQLLKNVTSDIFCAGRSKRIYVEKEKGYPYLGNTDITSSEPLSRCNYASRKFWKEKKGFLHEGMILTGRVGQNTVGSYSFASKDLEGTIGSDNVIRIINNGSLPNGYLFSFLSSYFGYSISRRHISGNAQPFITEEMLGDLPIPILNESIQNQCNDLVLKASKLREKSNQILSESIKLIEKEIEFINSKEPKVGVSTVNTLKENYHKRVDSPTYINQAVQHFEKVNNGSGMFKPVNDLGFSVTRPGIFKRVKVDRSHGIPYIKGSELSKNNPFDLCEYLSRTKTPFLEELRLRTDQILFTCAGTIGEVKIITKEYEERNAIGSQDIIRIEQSHSSIPIQYLFAYLKTNFVKEYSQSLKYGSVIERVEPLHVQMIPVIVPNQELIDTISNKIREYQKLFYDAFKAEEQAIDLVEKEIESWQK